MSSVTLIDRIEFAAGVLNYLDITYVAYSNISWEFLVPTCSYPVVKVTTLALRHRISVLPNCVCVGDLDLDSSRIHVDALDQ